MPKTKRINTHGGKLHGHYIRCPGCDDIHVLDTRWSFSGDLERPTFHPSLLVYADPESIPSRHRCHSFIRDGRIQFLSDCEHSLAGKTVDLPELED